MSIKIEVPKDELERLYSEDKLSTRKIARLYNCNASAIQRRLKEYSLTIRYPKQKINITKESLTDLYINKKLSTYKIADIYNCKANTILRHLNKYCKITARPLKKIKISETILRDLYLTKKLSLCKIAKVYGCSDSVILDKLKKSNIERRNKFEANIIHERKSFSGDLIEKAYIIGFRLGDLNVRKQSEKTIVVKTNTTKIDQVTLIRELFGNYGYVYVRKEDDMYWTQCALNESFNFLLEKKDEIKEWILRKDRLFFAFLGGYTDAEGNIGVYSGRARFRVGSYDKNLLFQAYNRLNNIGIVAHINLETVKGTIYGGVRKNGDFWRINVSSKLDLLKLICLLKPYIKHSKRRGDLLKAEKNIMERNKKFGTHGYNTKNGKQKG